MIQHDKISTSEWCATLSLAAIYSARMLGLFMILPVFSVYAQTLHGTTPFLIGVALGIYGLTQACLQIPFGLISDKIGRKYIIFIGLCLFALGSIIAARAVSIEGVIIGRALQGTGAIGSTLTALLADLTREQHRTKAMTVIGMTIASSFCLAMLLGPFIDALVGVKGIFWLSALLSCFAIVILITIVPKPKRSVFHKDTELATGYLGEILTNKALLLQNLSIFMLHAILTATFIAIPLVIERITDFSARYNGLLYLFALLPAFLLMVPCVILAEKGQRMKQVYISAIFLITLTQLSLLFFHRYYSVVIVMLIFFAKKAVNYLLSVRLNNIKIVALILT